MAVSVFADVSVNLAETPDPTDNARSSVLGGATDALDRVRDDMGADTCT